MAYVHRLINGDEKLIGIARLHWIYILQGLMWFLAIDPKVPEAVRAKTRAFGLSKDEVA